MAVTVLDTPIHMLDRRYSWVGGDNWYAAGMDTISVHVAGAGSTRRRMDRLLEEKKKPRRFKTIPCPYSTKGFIAWYSRVGYDTCRLLFQPDGTIYSTRSRCELYWRTVEFNGESLLIICGPHFHDVNSSADDEITAVCRWIPEDARWVGDWVRFEKMRLIVEPIAGGAV